MKIRWTLLPDTVQGMTVTLRALAEFEADKAEMAKPMGSTLREYLAEWPKHARAILGKARVVFTDADCKPKGELDDNGSAFENEEARRAKAGCLAESGAPYDLDVCKLVDKKGEVVGELASLELWRALAFDEFPSSAREDRRSRPARFGAHAQVDDREVEGGATTYSSAAMLRTTRGVAAELAVLDELSSRLNERVRDAVAWDVLEPYRWIREDTKVVPKVLADALDVRVSFARGTVDSLRFDPVPPGVATVNNAWHERDVFVLSRERERGQRSLKEWVPGHLKTVLRAPIPSGKSDSKLDPQWIDYLRDVSTRESRLVEGADASNASAAPVGCEGDACAALEFGVFADEATAVAWEQASEDSDAASRRDRPRESKPEEAPLHDFIASLAVARGEEWLSKYAGVVHELRLELSDADWAKLKGRRLLLEIDARSIPGGAPAQFSTSVVACEFAGELRPEALRARSREDAEMPLRDGYLDLDYRMPWGEHELPAFALQQQDVEAASSWLVRNANDDRRSTRAEAVVDDAGRKLWLSLGARAVERATRAPFEDVLAVSEDASFVRSLLSDHGPKRSSSRLELVAFAARDVEAAPRLELRGESIALIRNGRGRLTFPDQNGVIRYAEDLVWATSAEIARFTAAKERVSPWFVPGQRVEDYSDWGFGTQPGRSARPPMDPVVPARMSAGRASKVRLIERRNETLFRYEMQALGARTQGVDVETQAKLERPFEQLVKVSVASRSLPGLQFTERDGEQHRYGVRVNTIDLAGRAMGEVRTDGPVLWTEFRRYRPVPAPRVLVDYEDRFRPDAVLGAAPCDETNSDGAGAKEGEDAPTVVRDPQLLLVGPDRMDVDARYVVPERVSKDLLAMHGLAAKGKSPWAVSGLRGLEIVDGCVLPRVGPSCGRILAKHSREAGVDVYRRQSGEPVEPSAAVDPYLPDPAAEYLYYAIVPVDHLSELQSPIEGRVPAYAEGDAWPRASAIRVELRKGSESTGAQHRWRAAKRVLELRLAPGWRARLLLRHGPEKVARHFVYQDPQFCDAFAAARASLTSRLGEDVQARLFDRRVSNCEDAACALRLATRVEEINLVHHVPDPSPGPAISQGRLASREAGSTSARADFLRAELDTRFFESVHPLLRWTDPVDDPQLAEPGEREQSRELPVLEAPRLAKGTSALTARDVILGFGDTKHRVCKIVGRGAVRTLPGQKGAVRGDAPAGLVAGVDSLMLRVPSSARPLPPCPYVSVPLVGFAHGAKQLAGATELRGFAQTMRGRAVRLYLARGWFSSGAGERLGLVLARADFSSRSTVVEEKRGELVMRKQRPDWPFSCWGGDPAFGRTVASQWMRSADFDFDDAWQRSDAPLPPIADDENTRPVLRSDYEIWTRMPTYCPVAKLWFVDLHFADAEAELAFTRLSLVRVQEESIRSEEDLRVSEIEYYECVRPLPNRELVVAGRARRSPREGLVIAVLGRPVDAGDSFAQPGREGNTTRSFEIELLMRARHAGGALGWTRDARARFEEISLDVGESLLQAWRLDVPDVHGERRLLVREKEVFWKHGREIVGERTVYAGSLDL